MSIKVFVSSTYVDLKEHRQRVIAQLRRAGYHVDPMEDWTSDADEPTRFCLDRLYDCQACVLLVGLRRGFIPMGQERSITQMEYYHALDQGIDVLPFLLDDRVSGWPDQHDDRMKDPQLKEWREYIGLHHGVEWFTADPVLVDVLPAFSRWRARQYEREQVRDYLASLRTAHGVIRFLGLPTPQDHKDIRIDRLFVEPWLSRHLISTRHNPEWWDNRWPLGEVVGEDHRLAILGDPGSGKSTLVDWLAWQLADEHPNAWKARLGNRIPIPLILRDLRIPRGITWDGVLDAFLTRPLGMHPSREYLLRLMDAGHALVLLDGLDEIGATQTRRDLRDAVLSRFRRFERCLWLLTSRVIGYDDVPFHLAPDLVRTVHNLETDRGQAQTPLVTLAYIAPFGDTQIAQFAKNWYTEREANRESARAAAEQLVQAVHRDPDTLQLARVPNLLTMMALIHRNQASLPHGKTLLYEDIVQAYLKTIDEFRQITEYTDPLQEMKRWLSEVGFKMHQQLVDREAQGIWIDDELPDEVLLFDGDTLRGWLGEAMAGTGSPAAAPDVHQFTDIIKRRSGLIIERGDNQFAFVHLSFQEYFAAVYLAGWVTSAEWLLGEAVPPGTAAADLQRYATNTTWQKTLVFLLELLDGATPLGKKKIREAVFGPEWSAVTGESVPWTASLLARLTSNPHVHWDPSIKASALERCLTVVAEYHDRQYRDRGPELNTDILSVNTGILRHLLTGESASSRERFQRLVDRWASTGNPRLALLWIPLTDLSLLARLTNLQYVNLNHTLVTDLSPLAGLTNLRSIVLMSTPVTDLSPLAGLTNLRFLDLGHTSVSDLSPLAGLTNLQFLDLSSTPVTEDEVAKLKARLTGLEVRLSEPMSGNLWSYAEAQSPGAHPPFLEGLSERDECGR